MRHHVALISLIAGLLTAGSSVAGGASELALPLACTPGRDCWIVHHVDHDPGPAVRDHACGTLSYDGHDGIDLAISDEIAMARGVVVLAAAAGVVRGVRDGQPDLAVEQRGQEAVEGKECGNGVMIEHADGLRTQYCHLRAGSVAVRTGQEVPAGQALGMVGLSGLTSFPHLHLSVLDAEGRKLDPFTGIPVGQGTCGQAAAPLWRPEIADGLAYQPLPVTGAGLLGIVPDGARIWRGPGDGPLAAGSPRLVGWMRAYAARKGDVVRIRIVDPAGAVRLDHEVTIERDQARIARWAGLRRNDADWSIGPWRVLAELRRGTARVAREAVVEVVPR